MSMFVVCYVVLGGVSGGEGGAEARRAAPPPPFRGFGVGFRSGSLVIPGPSATDGTNEVIGGAVCWIG